MYVEEYKMSNEYLYTRENISFSLASNEAFVSNVCHCSVSFVSYHFNPFTSVSATDTVRFYSVWCQTILLVNGEPLRCERVKINVV